MNDASLRARGLAIQPESHRSDRLDGGQLIQMLGRSWRLIILVVVAVVGITALYLSRQEPVYRAVSAMALMNSELRISQVDTQLESYELTRARVETEMDRLRSRSFAERVAAKLDLFKDTSYLPVGENGPALGSPERRRAVVDKLLQSYEPQRSGESLVIYIEAHANSAALAAGIANGVVESFIRQSVEAQVQTIEQSTRHLRKQVDEVGEQLTVSQMEMANLIRENVLDDDELPEQLRRQRSHLASVLGIMDSRGGETEDRDRIAAELTTIEEQLAERTRNEMQLSRLERGVDLLTQRYQTMVERLNQIEPQLDQIQPDARQVTVAETPVEPSWPNMPTTLALAVPGGLMLGFVLALLKSAMDRRIWTGSQANQISHLPNLGRLPRIPSTGMLRRQHRPAWFLRRFPRSQYSEALRSLMTMCTGLEDGGTVPAVTMITSPLSKDGKSTIAVSVGAVAALEGMRVLLLDFDTQQVGGRHLTGLQGPPVPLADLIEGRLTLADAVKAVPDYQGFDVIRFDRQTHLTPRTVFAFREGPLARMKAEYDMVIMDTPSALAVSDAARLGMLANASLVVIRSGRTTEGALRNCIDRLQNSGVRLAGTVINDIDPRRFRRMNMGRADAYY
jgi:succinoglycan biosynthesis transport protein ExoP